MLEDPVRSVRISAAFVLADAGSAIPKRYKEAYDKALAEGEQALLAQADFSSGRLRKAQLKMSQGDVVSAEKAFQSALRLDQDHAPAVSAATNFYYGRGQFDKAAAVYQQFLARNPSEAWANYELGLLFAEMQRLEEATSYLGKAAASSDDPRYSYNWGLALQNLGKTREAEQAFLSGLQKAPGQGYLEYALAVLYYQQGNLAKARKLAQGLLKKEPRNAEYAQLVQALGL
jgi:tetratricopeptide (TPR) repeat protein